MCTATWIRTNEGYELFFNRDELRTRAPAWPPSVRDNAGVRFIAPTDGDAGGTWLGVNERGLTIGLANGPVGESDGTPRTFRSRGLLVLDLLSSTSVGEVGALLGPSGGLPYRPFELFAIGARGEGHIWSWDGREIRRREADAQGVLLISSSRDPQRARAERTALLERYRRELGSLDGKLLADFHASHEPERGAWSPCMHREDASTVSESRIRVTRDEVTFTYLPGPPCERPSPVLVKIPKGRSV
ncbi:MAG: NRDE family protein [Planctomycetota bacterium]